MTSETTRGDRPPDAPRLPEALKPEFARAFLDLSNESGAIILRIFRRRPSDKPLDLLEAHEIQEEVARHVFQKSCDILDISQQTRDDAVNYSGEDVHS